MGLGNNLRKCRFEQNEMSQASLAKNAGVSRQTIISIEKGKFNPTMLLALKIARVFNKNVEEIFFLKPSVENNE
jgi:putative transcriptional regulator